VIDDLLDAVTLPFLMPYLLLMWNIGNKFLKSKFISLKDEPATAESSVE
jgi:hypothetical protein